jgi:hypothetical protein
MCVVTAVFDFIKHQHAQCIAVEPVKMYHHSVIVCIIGLTQLMINCYIYTLMAHCESRQSSATYADLNTAVLDGVHCMEALVQARAAFTTATATAATATAASTKAAAAGADVVPLSVLTSALTSAACSVRSRRLDECCPRLCEELAAQCSIDRDSSGRGNGKITDTIQ